MSKISVSLKALRNAGVEALPRGSSTIALPKNCRIEAPSSLKWTEIEHSLHLGAFSYQVSGYCFAARIGRYCSFGENVQIGRQNHPLTWGTGDISRGSDTADGVYQCQRIRSRKTPTPE